MTPIFWSLKIWEKLGWTSMIPKLQMVLKHFRSSSNNDAIVAEVNLIQLFDFFVDAIKLVIVAKLEFSEHVKTYCIVYTCVWVDPSTSWIETNFQTNRPNWYFMYFIQAFNLKTHKQQIKTYIDPQIYVELQIFWPTYVKNISKMYQFVCKLVFKVSIQRLS